MASPATTPKIARPEFNRRLAASTPQKPPKPALLPAKRVRIALPAPGQCSSSSSDPATSLDVNYSDCEEPAQDTSEDTLVEESSPRRRKRMDLTEVRELTKHGKQILVEARVVAGKANKKLLQLLKEVEKSVSALGQSVEQHYVEYDLELVQPIRRENADLRRKVRLLEESLENRAQFDAENHSLRVELEAIKRDYASLKDEQDATRLRLLECQQEAARLKNQLLSTAREEDNQLAARMRQLELQRIRMQKDLDLVIEQNRRMTMEIRETGKVHQVLQEKDAELNGVKRVWSDLKSNMRGLIDDLQQMRSSDVSSAMNQSSHFQHLEKLILGRSSSTLSTSPWSSHASHDSLRAKTSHKPPAPAPAPSRRVDVAPVKDDDDVSSSDYLKLDRRAWQEESKSFDLDSSLRSCATTNTTVLLNNLSQDEFVRGIDQLDCKIQRLQKQLRDIVKK